MEGWEKKTLKNQNKKNYDSDCRASAFRDLRTLKKKDCLIILQRVIDREISLFEVNVEAKKIKQMREVQLAVVNCLAAESWEEVKER